MNSGGGAGSAILEGKRMEIDQIRKLIELMVANDLSELDISDGETKVKLKRGPGELHVVSSPVASVAAPAPEAVAPPAAEPEEVSPPEELVEIRSPMVGTFYTAPSPDSEDFVSVGSPVAEDTVVSIVEAMKVMNEIKAECTGTVAEVCVANAQPVEFGQVLFRVRPA